jgi:hypothetical protein
VPRPEHRLDVGRAAVAEAHPDDLRGRAAQEAPLTEVVVLRDDREPAAARVGPDGLVVDRLQTEVPYVGGARVQVGEPPGERRGEVLVE